MVKENEGSSACVVVFSMGRKFLLTSDEGRYPASWFISSVLPEIEKTGSKQGNI
jgi:hypothetical protein